MTQKIAKIIFILLIILSLSISFVSATDINLNLPGTSDGNTTTDNEQDPVENVVNNEVNNNQASTNQTNPPETDQNTMTEDNNTLDDAGGLTDPFETTDTETLQPGSVTTSPESGLGITNIINILLITVGVIIILLAIAIIIRLKK